jgi:hypothetical protein
MIQRSIAQVFLQGLEKAYMELPKQINLKELPERNTFPIKTLVVRTQIILFYNNNSKRY